MDVMMLLEILFEPLGGFEAPRPAWSSVTSIF